MPETLSSTPSLDRLPPHDPNAEAAVLGACLLDPAAMDLAIEALRTDDFFRNAHQKTFDAIKALAAANVPVDLVTVSDWLASRGLLEVVGGPEGLAGLTEKVASAANVLAYCGFVADNAKLRAVIAAAAQVSQLAYQPGAEAASVTDKATALILDATEHHTGAKVEHSGEVVFRTVELIKSFEQKKGAIEFATNFPKLDDYLQGVEVGMTVIAGRPGSGKTAFGLNLASEFGILQQRPGAIFSFEMPSELLLLRVLSSMASVNAKTIKRGLMSKGERDRVVRAAERLAEAPIYITPPGKMDLDGIRASLRRLQRQKGITWFFVDYLQRVPSGLKRVDTRAQEVGYISTTLSNLCLDLGLRGIVAAQLNRESVRTTTGADTPPRRPRLSDLRDSGDIEQDATNVLLLHRPNAPLDGAGKPEDEAAELVLAKQRNGEVGVVEVCWQGQFTRFMPIQLPPSSSGVPPFDPNRRNLDSK